MKERQFHKAIFAAGCFWDVEKAFFETPGVENTRVGYTGGITKNPTYEEVCTGKTGHAEAVEVTYDPRKITYNKLLDVFWRIHDPTTLNRQGPDIGTQYRSAIFYLNDERKKLVYKSKGRMEKTGLLEGKPIVTEIVPAGEFFQAEKEHQKYFIKHPGQC